MEFEAISEMEIKLLVRKKEGKGQLFYHQNQHDNFAQQAT